MMSSTALPAPRERWKQRLGGAGLTAAAVLCGLVFAKLTAMGLWYVGLVILAVDPALVRVPPLPDRGGRSSGSR